MNLKRETLKILEFNNRSWDDVLWVGGDDFKIDKDLFLKLADKNYDNGFGGQEVAKDLVIVGTDFWMKRGEYDGSEWWDFYWKEFEEPKETREIKSLFGKIGWDTLAEINSEKELEYN